MLARFMSEENYAALNREAIQKMPFFLGLSLLCLPAIFLMMLGLMMMLLFPESNNRWSFDMAEGTMAAAAAILIFYPIRFFSEHRLAEHVANESDEGQAVRYLGAVSLLEGCSFFLVMNVKVDLRIRSPVPP